MREDPTPAVGDLDRRAFSNGTEWEFWANRNCSGGLGCIHDSIYGQPDEEFPVEVHCPLIGVSLIADVTPHEWLPLVGGQPGSCSAFTDRLPEAAPDPVVTVDLFGTYAAEPPA